MISPGFALHLQLFGLFVSCVRDILEAKVDVSLYAMLFYRKKLCNVTVPADSQPSHQET